MALSVLSVISSRYRCIRQRSPGEPPVLSQSRISLVKQLTDRPDLVAGVNAIDLLDVTESATVLRDDSGQRRVHAPGRDHVIARDVLHLLQFVLGLEVTHRDDLNGLLGTAWNVDEHRSEVAHAFAGRDLGTQLLFVLLGQVRVIGVEDVSRMRAVAVVTPAKQCCCLVEQQCLQTAQVLKDGDIVLTWTSKTSVVAYLKLRPLNCPKDLTANIALDLSVTDSE